MAVAEYYNRANVDLLRLIPPDAQFVLEAGSAREHWPRHTEGSTLVFLTWGLKRTPRRLQLRWRTAALTR